MKDLKIPSFRFSFSWPRILPDGYASNPNPKGVEFYETVLKNLTEAGIAPQVTLYHWDLPSSLNDKTDNGGWLNPLIVERFNEYAEFCFKTFGKYVKTWITINEP